MLNAKKARAIRRLYAAGEWTCEDLSVLFGTTESNVAKVVRGDSWGSATGGENLSRFGADTEYRRAHIATRLEQGTHSLAAIGRELGITGQAVGELIKRYKISGGNTCSED